jgi:3-hydroxyisobutyrate dehydrogenase-like beta-hydroxyacid dehydrogenase
MARELGRDGGLTIGVVGLGLMGSTIGGRLRASGFRTAGYDVVPAAREHFAQAGGVSMPTIAALSGACDVILLSLPTGDIGIDVCLGTGGVATSGSPPSLVVDTTTARPAESVKMAEGLADVGIGFLDATLSGNSDQAASGDLVAMVGGVDEHLETVRPVLGTFARSIHHVGPVGSGTRAKLVVNLVLGIHRMALAEGLVLGERGGLDLEVLLEVLRDGAAYSRAMDIWGDRMLAGDHEPPASRIRQSHKDFRLIQEEAVQTASPAWLSSVVRQLLQSAELTGLGDIDNSGVIEYLRRQAGIGRLRRADP